MSSCTCSSVKLPFEMINSWPHKLNNRTRWYVRELLFWTAASQRETHQSQLALRMSAWCLRPCDGGIQATFKKQKWAVTLPHAGQKSPLVYLLEALEDKRERSLYLSISANMAKSHNRKYVLLSVLKCPTCVLNDVAWVWLASSKEGRGQ